MAIYTQTDYDFYALVDGDRRTCPHCAVAKPLPHFGLRTVGGRVVPQSWCRKCRRDDAAAKRAAAKAAL